MQPKPLLSDLEIARGAVKRPIQEVAATIGLTDDDLIPYGRHVAKVSIDLLGRLQERPRGKLILVTAMTPTSMGEGKTTNTIGLGQALTRLGKRTMIAIREPSLGPCFGVKGGAAGGGWSQVLPMEEINLHFTGDLHAVTTAHNLLAAVIDNHLHQRNAPELNPRKVVWRRVMDMNDRSLRQIVLGLQGAGSNGVMREDGFEITAASEVMAVLCLARDLQDLKTRLGRIIVGYDPLSRPVLAAELRAPGAMAALLKHAIHPNLVQTIEGTPVFVHGGPFGNITHQLKHRDVDLALEKVSAAVHDWSGGTRIGSCLKEFNKYWSRRVLGQGAVVLLITDGLDQNAGEGLGDEVERLHLSCRRLIWLNPLLRYKGFEPKSLGIRAILPHVDEFRPVHNLEALRDLADVLSKPAPADWSRGQFQLERTSPAPA